MKTCRLSFSFRYNGNLIIVFFKPIGIRILLDKNNITIGILNDVGALQRSGKQLKNLLIKLLIFTVRDTSTRQIIKLLLIIQTDIREAIGTDIGSTDAFCESLFFLTFTDIGSYGIQYIINRIRG